MIDPKEMNGLIDLICQAYFSRFDFRGMIKAGIDILEPTWAQREYWKLTGNKVNLKRSFEMDFYQADVVLFRKPAGWKSVLHCPGSNAIRGKRYWPTAMEAAEAAYPQFRDAILGKLDQSSDPLITHDTFRLDGIHWLIRNNVPKHMKSSFMLGLYDRGVNL